jgi:hypothetical protein
MSATASGTGRLVPTYSCRSAAKLILRKSRRHVRLYPLPQSISDAREDAMTNASNALMWTALYFALAFGAIFVVWFADKIRSSLLGK